MQRPSLAAIRGSDRAVYVVAGGRLLTVFGSGLVYPFATVHFHLQVGLALSLVGLYLFRLERRLSPAENGVGSNGSGGSRA